ncbi:glucuronosyltransferase [Oryctes borbonicus]|uniref:Glucuronosyltransferase n=1 Tax=Oryctes borbonicus TaxID=1629725 RepID=A0A0T6BD44_9SCAR|nr:glucuronosyltransferase [Oryctes borbonicus]
MPQFGDQYTNAKALEASGGGVILDFSTITEEDIYGALRAVLDPSFNKQAKELSARFKDRPMPPLETAVYWVEYVARHKGAHHLRSAAVGMPYYQYLLLDVVLFLAVTFLTISYVFYATCRFALGKLFKKEEKKVKRQ